MTDNEIIKTLECCQSNKCNECPMLGTNNCMNVSIGKTLNLINRQKAEIERLEKEKDSKLVMCIANDIRKAKSEAIKEFAERFKRKILPYICCGRISFIRAEYELDKLVKEMTEVQE